eukprot:GEMP01005867.1.p1 GENE.GEMP01005867.1~~GEMP01005867.1.p1  ORF type:complete len:604 (+),score=84.48 GEMP01005867.1:197-2008(+)
MNGRRSERYRASRAVRRSTFEGGRPKKATRPTRFWSKNCTVAVFQVGCLTFVTACALAILVNTLMRIHPEVGRGLQLVGSLFLAPLPIVSYFFMRHGRSASLGQAALTFTEAICWMFPYVIFLMVSDLDRHIVSTFGSVEVKTCPHFNLTSFLDPNILIINDDINATHNAPIIIMPDTLSTEFGCYAPSVHWFNFDSSLEHGIQFTLENVTMDDGVCIHGRCMLKKQNEWVALIKYVGNDTALNKTALGSTEVHFPGLHRTLDSAAVLALGRGAFFEEIIKYIAVRGVVYSTRVVDPGSLLVYSLAGAAGFAVMENLLYTIYFPMQRVSDLSLNVLFFRMLSAVPLHLMTGVLIGCALGWRRFFRYGPKVCCCAASVTLALPILLHGSYNFILTGGFLLFDEDDFSHDETDHYMLQISYVLFFMANLVTMVGWLIVRYLWLRLTPICIVNIRSLLDRNIVVSPLAGRCLCLDLQARCMMDPCIILLGRIWTPESLKSDGDSVLLPRLVHMACRRCKAAIFAHSHVESECPYCFTPQPPTDFGCLRPSALSSVRQPGSSAAIELAPMADPLLPCGSDLLQRSTPPGSAVESRPDVDTTMQNQGK